MLAKLGELLTSQMMTKMNQYPLSYLFTHLPFLVLLFNILGNLGQRGWVNHKVLVHFRGLLGFEAD